MAANRQAKTDRYTHMHNAVSLVWGSLRLAPITIRVFVEASFRLCSITSPLLLRPASSDIIEIKSDNFK